MGVPRQTEKSFQATVVAFARLHGWSCYHVYDARRTVPGWPDLTLVRDGVLVFAELKVGKNRTTAAQDRWLSLLGAVPGVRAVRWTPESWPEIERVLGG